MGGRAAKTADHMGRSASSVRRERFSNRFEPQDMNHPEPLPSGLLGRVQLIAGGLQ